jgi:hypothetical protein
MLALIITRTQSYWERVKEWAAANSDGCTGVKDIHVHCCWEHDYHFRHARTLDGEPITFDETNLEFRKCIQAASKLGRFSPLSWIRWLGVKHFGRAIWDRHRLRENETHE